MTSNQDTKGSSAPTLQDPLNEALGLWRMQMRSDSYSAKTINMRVGVVTKLCTEQGITDGRMSENDVRVFLDDGDYTPNTTLTYLRAFRQWSGFADFPDPTARIRRPRTPEFVPRPVTEPQLDVLLKHADPRMAAWIKLGAYAGLRAAETATLRGTQFYDQGSSVTLFVQGKGRKPAPLPIAPHVWNTVRPFIHGKERLWDVTSQYLSMQFRAYSHSLGMDLGYHQNRHRFGTIVYQQTRDLLVTQRLLRHASPKQTTAYVLVSDDAQPVVDSLPYNQRRVEGGEGRAQWEVRVHYERDSGVHGPRTAATHEAWTQLVPDHTHGADPTTMPDEYQKILAAVQEAGRPVRIRDVCAAIGIAGIPKHNEAENVRRKANRLVDRGWLKKAARGQYTATA